MTLPRIERHASQQHPKNFKLKPLVTPARTDSQKLADEAIPNRRYPELQVLRARAIQHWNEHL
jgi:hypothetical protein